MHWIAMSYSYIYCIFILLYPMQESIKQNSKSKVISTKWLIGIYFFVIGIVVLNTGPWAIFAFIIAIIVIFSLFVKVASKLLAGSWYTTKDLLWSNNKEVREYMMKKFQKIPIPNSQNVWDETIETTKQEETNAPIQLSISEEAMTNNGWSPSDEKQIHKWNQIGKIINSIVGIVAISVFLLNILQQNPVWDKILFYVTNLFSRDSSNRQTHNSYILPIILVILIVFVIFMLIKALISYHKAGIKPPFNS